MSIEYSGGTAPVGTPPWITATFDDHGSTGSVTLTLQTPNLTNAEFVREWDFNLDPALSVGNLAFSAPSKTGAFTNPTINLAANSFMADGDGKYDIQFLFDNTDGAPNRFGVGDSVSYTISGISSLTANSFNFLSAPNDGHTLYLTAAHIQGIGPDGEGSGWVAVPEPSSCMLTAIGLLGLAILRQRRQVR